MTEITFTPIADGEHVPASPALVDELRFERTQSEPWRKPLHMIEWHAQAMHAERPVFDEYARVFEAWYAENGATPTQEQLDELKISLTSLAPSANAYAMRESTIAVIVEDFQRRRPTAMHLMREQLARMSSRYPGARLPLI